MIPVAAFRLFLLDPRAATVLGALLAATVLAALLWSVLVPALGVPDSSPTRWYTIATHA